MPRTGCIGWAASTDLWMKASCAYAAGAVGGVCNALMAILLQVVGINAALHVTWDALPYKPGWLYNKMVWGGFWAMLYLLPLRRPHWLVRGLLFGLIASTVHCAIVFTAQGGGFFATKTGKLTWVIVYITDACWALGSASVFQLTIGRFRYKVPRYRVDGTINDGDIGDRERGSVSMPHARYSGGGDDLEETPLTHALLNGAEFGAGKPFGTESSLQGVL